MLQSMGWQRVGHDWVTELNWTWFWDSRDGPLGGCWLVWREECAAWPLPLSFCVTHVSPVALPCVPPLPQLWTCRTCLSDPWIHHTYSCLSKVLSWPVFPACCHPISFLLLERSPMSTLSERHLFLSPFTASCSHSWFLFRASIATKLCISLFNFVHLLH